MARYQTVNRVGLAEIDAILTANHKRGDAQEWADLNAWAADVEKNLLLGNGPGFELRAVETLNGCTQWHTLSPLALDWHGYDDE